MKIFFSIAVVVIGFISVSSIGFVQESAEIFEFRINGVTVASDANLTTLILSSETGLIEYDNGKQKMLIKIPSDAEFEKEIPAGLKQEEHELLRQKLIQQKFASLRSIPREDKVNTDTLSILNAIVGRGSELEQIGASPEQREKLQEISKDYSRQVQEINEKYGSLPKTQRDRLAATAKQKLKSEVAESITKVLLPHQLEFLAGWSPSKLGIMKTLTETPAGEIIGLSEMELESLREETDEVVEELKAEIEAAREKLMVVYDKHLTDKQRKDIKNEFGNIANENIQRSSVTNLIRMMDYEERSERK